MYRVFDGLDAGTETVVDTYRRVGQANGDVGVVVEAPEKLEQVRTERGRRVDRLETERERRKERAGILTRVNWTLVGMDDERS